MLTLSSTTATEVAKSSTQPFYIVELLFSTPLRLSSGPTCSWNSQTWTANGVGVRDILQLDGGGQKAVIRLPNTDNSASALVMSDGIVDVGCNIWQLYGAGPYAVGDAVQIFSGVIDSVDEMTLSSVLMQAVSDSARREKSPRIYFDHICRYLPPAGRVLAWNGQYFKLETRNG